MLMLLLMANTQSKRKHLVVELFLIIKVQYSYLWEKNFYNKKQAHLKYGVLYLCLTTLLTTLFNTFPPISTDFHRNYDAGNGKEKTLQSFIYQGFTRFFTMVAEEGLEPTTFGL
jgi:hypothetical protein